MRWMSEMTDSARTKCSDWEMYSTGNLQHIRSLTPRELKTSRCTHSSSPCCCPTFERGEFIRALNVLDTTNGTLPHSK